VPGLYTLDCPLTFALLLRVSRVDVQIPLCKTPLHTDHVLVRVNPQPLLWLMPELQRFPLTAIVSRNRPPESAGLQEEGIAFPVPQELLD
jgi:hypothetical protein